MENLTMEFKIEQAVKLAHLDAIEKGCKDAKSLARHSETKEFKKSVKHYIKLITENFG